MSDLQLQGVPVLIVEDDPANARMLATVCTSAGAEVRIAHTAREALDLLPTFPARMAVVDLILPEMSGLLLIQELKSKPATASIVLIATSVVNGSDVERLVLQIGCAAFIRKPVDIDAVVALMVEHLRGHQ